MPFGPNLQGSTRLKSQLARALLLLASLVLLASAFLITTALVQQRATEQLRFAFRGALIASDLEGELFRLNRMYQQRLKSRSAKVEEEFLIARIRSNIEQARLHVADPVEDDIIERLTTSLDEVVPDIQEPGLTPEERLERWQPAFEQLRANVRALNALNRSMATSAQVRTEEWNRLVLFTSTAIVLVLLASVILLARNAKRRILDPLDQLGIAIQEFRDGQRGIRAPEMGPTELARIGRAFNELADALRRQQDNQTRFIASVVHDFRNPLTALRNSSALLLRDKSIPDNPAIRKAMEVSSRQVDQLSRIADDLLTAIRIEAGHLDLQMETCDLRDIARASVELYENTSEMHVVRFCAPEHPVLIRGDPARLEQVTNNLLSNAIKYSPQGGRVDVAIVTEGEEAVLSVTDQGIGIKEEDIPVLFEPFRRLSASRETIPGVGLGLSVVHRIVEAHGGRIEVESEAGYGSRLSIRLKRYVEKTPSQDPECDESRPNGSPTADR